MMDCEAIRDAVRAERATTGADVDAHRAQCATCDALLRAPEVGRWLGRASAPPESSSEAVAELTARVGRDGWRERLWGLSTRGRRAILFGAIAGWVVATSMLWPRGDLAVYPALRLLLVGGAWAASAWLGLRTAMRPWHRPPLSAMALGALTIGLGLALPFVLATLPPAHAAYPPSMVGVGADFGGRAMQCAAVGLASALPVLGLAALLSPGRRSTEALWTAAVGAAALGALVLHVHCPLVSIAHHVAGHAGMAWGVLAGSVAYALARPR